MPRPLHKEFLKGLWEEIPPFRLVLGLCPVLAVTMTVENGIGMGLATTFVLVCSNVLISILRNQIPPKVRIACYILVIATFVTIVDMLMQAFTYPLYQKLGIFIPLIVVNCVVLGRAEAFASKNSVLPSLADGLGIGIGFTLSLAALGALREAFGNGTLLGHSIFGPGYQPLTFLVEAPGAFIGLGILLGLMNLISQRR
ncbi:electron transport complex protein RnfE [Desulfobotulus alkaliphilus]|uniref:Ion-translocating oxidoreductase complex subunit E n=2 Tax=Desulfobotulus TaxID=48001 RepID=A0A562R7T7_9BACT|nr:MULTISPECIES: electron transport complex subunit E [Desulfobotulus]TWI64624.1 electron transport complex protein RnfE [Desulfobotulus alkaliphilus]TYT73551.1 electron transport complex subunit E [Desulfobotulus mexicanus]